MTLKAHILLLLSLCCSVSIALAQYPSQDGNFQVDVIKGCSPLTVNITVTPPLICDATNPCNVIFGDDPTDPNKPEVFTSSHTYTTPGTYLLRVIIGQPINDRIVIEVLPDIQPEFEVYQCAGGNNVVVNITDPHYDQYTITYSDGATVMVGPNGTDTHGFATPGNKTVSVKGRKIGYEDNCSPMVKSITAGAPLTNGSIPQLNVLSPTDIQLTFSNADFILYKLEIARNGGTFQQLQDVYGLTTLNIPNLTTDTEYYCFRLGTYDPCAAAVIGYSDVICSADFDATAQNNQNFLQWRTSSTGVSDFSVTKTTATNSFPDLTASAASSSLNDTDVICSIEYTYQLITNYANGAISTSLIKRATAFSTTPPTAVENITASVLPNTTVTLDWTQDPAFLPQAYSVYKTAKGKTTLLTETTETTLVDQNYDTSTPTCYTISYKDRCDNASAMSAAACPVQLTGDVLRDNTVILNWSAYTGWLNGVDSYTISKFDARGQLLETYDNVAAASLPNFSDPDSQEDLDNQIYIYKIEAIPTTASIKTALSNDIMVTKRSNVFFPTGFTPNSTNKDNTEFFIKSQYLAAGELNIFNRWGELIYTTKEVQTDNEGKFLSWDGKIRGTVMPEGTYAFRAVVTDLAGNTSGYSGGVYLLKRDR